MDNAKNKNTNDKKKMSNTNFKSKPGTKSLKGGSTKSNFANKKDNFKITNKIAKEQEILDWFYMSPKNINAKMISDIIIKRGSVEVELWEEMNILQINLKENKCIDFEPIAQPFKDQEDDNFVKEHNINTIFAVTIEESAFEPLQPIMKAVIEELDGFLCSDSKDFKPIFTFKDDIEVVI
jgi:hypothetical protein